MRAPHFSVLAVNVQGATQNVVYSSERDGLSGSADLSSCGSVRLGLFLVCFYPWVPHLSICSRKGMDQAGELCFAPAVVE